MRISDWSSDVCSSDLCATLRPGRGRQPGKQAAASGGAHYTHGTCPSQPRGHRGKYRNYRKLAARLNGSAGPRCRRESPPVRGGRFRSEEHTSELQSLMRISYAVFCLKKKKL